MFNINKFLPMTGFKLWTSGIGSDHSANWATQPLPFKLTFMVQERGHNIKCTNVIEQWGNV